MTDSRPIGVFDSGIGGLTVVRELRRQLPHESIIYFGDTARVPYGNKSRQTVIRYAVEAGALLMSYDVKSIVVACNTASAHAVGILREKFPVPVFGVIEPGVASAIRDTRNGKVLVIGTAGTVRSNTYQNMLREKNPELSIFHQPCPLFVPLVEEGWLDTTVTRAVIEEYLEPFRLRGVDTIILGCTHYPLLKPAIQEYWPEVTLVDSGVETARALAGSLKQEGLEHSAGPEGSCKFLVSDTTENFRTVGEMFLGTHMQSYEVVDMEKFLIQHQAIIDEKYV